MKLLHVSDWHVGRMTYGEPRAEDHDQVFSEMLALVRSERPDLVLHTGDLFDVVRPSYVDLTRGLSALHELAAVAPVVVVAGNHDSPALFRLLSQLLGPSSNLRFVDRANTVEDGGVMYFAGPRGEEVRLGCLPFLHAHRGINAFVPHGS